MYAALTAQQIIQIHDAELANSNGLSGIKEPGYLDFLSEKPFSTVFGEEQYPGLFLKAAVLMQGIAVSHCFYDGNKRTAALSTYVFLKMNGYELNVEQSALVEVTLQIATKAMDIHQLSLWLEKNTHQM